MTYRFFVHDPDGDSEKVRTQQEAIDTANGLIDFYRENSADDGWDELVEQIFWGEIKQTAEMVNKEAAPEGSGFDYTCDYALTDVPPEPGIPLVIPEGYQLVPIVPPAEILDEIDSIIDYGAEDSADVWMRLLNAVSRANQCMHGFVLQGDCALCAAVDKEYEQQGMAV